MSVDPRLQDLEEVDGVERVLDQRGEEVVQYEQIGRREAVEGVVVT